MLGRNVAAARRRETRPNDYRQGRTGAALRLAFRGVVRQREAMNASADRKDEHGQGGKPAAVSDTLSPGWESRFRLQWDVRPERGQMRRIEGYVQNERGSRFAVRLQLLALDASGAVVWRSIQQLPGEVPAFGRDSFEFRDVPVAEQYRVTVFSFDAIEAGG
jgi:hypothetical protein